MDNLLGVEEIDINSLLAVKIQSLIRRFLARCRVIDKVKLRFEKILDPRRKLHYYYDKTTDTSSWIKPALLGTGDIEDISPAYTDDRAAEIITGIYRRLRAWRRVQRLYAEEVEKVRIEGYKQKVYIKKASTVIMTKLPGFMEGTLRHPYPDEEDSDDESSDEEEEEEKAEEEEEEEEYDSDAERTERIENRKLPRSKAQELIDVVEENMGKNKGLTLKNKFLDLSSLGISRLSSRLWTLTSLQILNLSKNKLTKMSVDFKYLLNLQKLDLRENEITVVPKEIEDLKRLDVCLFGHNKISYIPGHFFKLFRMEVFDVSYNLFNPKAPYESGNMELLKDLKEWDISVGRFTKLLTFNASNNGIEEWPIQLERLEKLTELDLSNNRIESIPDIIAQMRALEYLDLSFNKITKLPAALFFLRNLKTLKFADNTVKGFDTQSLRNLERLVILDISNNKFESLNEELNSFSVVEIFRANNNCLGFIDDSLGSMIALQTLHLSSNALKMLPNSLQLCTLITDLNISNNKFETMPDSISFLSNLTNLDVSCCEISSGLFEDFFSKMTVLARLDLSRNKITRLPTSLYFLKCLAWCNLSSNLIAELSSEVNELESIVHLDFYRNCISLIPTSIQYLGNLEYLDISWNLIPFLPDEFGNLPKLNKFNAEHNRMMEYQHCLRNIKTLSSWNLNGNCLSFYIPTKSDATGDEGESVVEPITPSMLQRSVSRAFNHIAKCKYITLTPVSDLRTDELEEPKKGKGAKNGPPLSAAEKREIRRQKDQKLADEKALFDKKLNLTKSTFHWVSQYAAECKSSYQQVVENVTEAKAAFKSGISSPHVCRTLSTSSKLILEEYSKLSNDSDLDFYPNFEQMMNLNIECEIQDAIVMYENVARMLVAYCRNIGWFKDSSVDSIRQPFSITKNSESSGGTRNSQLLSDAMGIEDDPLNETLQPVMSNEVDSIKFPKVLFHPQLGPSKEEISAVAFQCYMELGSLVFRRVETISKTVRGIEKHYDFEESCLDITQRYGSDFEDIIFDEYEALKSRVESVGDGGQTTKVSRKSAFLNKMSTQLSVIPDSKEPSETPETEIKIDTALFSYKLLSDPRATVKYLRSAIKHMSLYALTLFCSAANIMSLWGWDCSCSEFKEQEEFLLEPFARGKKHIYIRLIFAYARVEQYLGRFVQASEKFENLRALFTMSNYTMFRKIIVEIIRTLIVRGEYFRANDYVYRLASRELAPSVSVFDTSEQNMIKILKNNRELGLYLLITTSSIKRLKGTGVESSEKLRVYNMGIDGQLDRGVEYSYEIVLGGKFDDSVKRTQVLEDAEKRAEDEQNSVRQDLRSKAALLSAKAKIVLQDSIDIMIIEQSAGNAADEQ